LQPETARHIDDEIRRLFEAVARASPGDPHREARGPHVAGQATDREGGREAGWSGGPPGVGGGT